MQSIFSRRALLAGGWATDVRLEIEHGRIVRIEENCSDTGCRTGDATICGIVIPGVCNAHSHAFQRALAGHTERRNPGSTDTFWSWRTLMYRLATRMTPALLESIAAQVYGEMLASGYTAVVEFNYLLGGNRRDASAGEFLEALVSAADEAGIRMTYVPVLYERGDFDEDELSPEQATFALDIDSYLAHCGEASDALGPVHRLGVGAHSLRAVSVESLLAIDRYSAAGGLPLHIHLAEQPREVEDCLRVTGATPVRWLLDSADVDSRWTAVHATHMDEVELKRLAGSGAVVAVCPSTEANLGDGIFRLRDFLEAGGILAIGSDSHISVNPYEELRWLEYAQRLTTGVRNVSAIDTPHTGSGLYQRVVDGGAQSSGLAGGRLEEGGPADLVVLDDDHPMLAGHGTETLLDALVFSGVSLPVDRVMVAGRWCVAEGRHLRGAGIASAYREAVRAANLCGAAIS